MGYYLLVSNASGYRLHQFFTESSRENWIKQHLSGKDPGSTDAFLLTGRGVQFEGTVDIENL